MPRATISTKANPRRAIASVAPFDRSSMARSRARLVTPMDHDEAMDPSTRVDLTAAYLEIKKHGAWGPEAEKWLYTQPHDADGMISARSVLEWLGY